MTRAQRARKIESARIHIQTALRDLDALADDFRDASLDLTAGDRETWRAVVGAHGDATRATGRLAGLL